jgi:hypothetical protein
MAYEGGALLVSSLKVMAVAAGPESSRSMLRVRAAWWWFP